MAKMIQVRNVSERLHRELTRRARRRGQTLTAFVEEILEREAARPAPEEVAARIRSRELGVVARLLRTAGGDAVGLDEDLHAPELCDLEIASSLRRGVQERHLRIERAAE